ncbi:Alcohol dehydrogenase 1 [Nymphaea thermarum]|nr:Alcohol dehydrogenase 1 [Nymphaea thermarum]
MVSPSKEFDCGAGIESSSFFPISVSVHSFVVVVVLLLSYLSLVLPFVGVLKGNGYRWSKRTNCGVDRSVECTGNINAMISAFECVHDGWGVAVLVGVPHQDAVFKTHPINFLNEKTLKGTFYGNYMTRTHIPGVVELYMKKELELDKFITHQISFSEINKAFDLMLSGQGIRCVMTMDS